MAKAKMVDAEDVAQIEALFKTVTNRGLEVQARLERSQLATRILAAFVRARTAVDLRVQSGEKRLAVVVGLVHLHTDTSDVDIDFQISLSGLTKLIKELHELHRQMEEAEKLVPVWEGPRK